MSTVGVEQRGHASIWRVKTISILGGLGLTFLVLACNTPVPKETSPPTPVKAITTPTSTPKPGYSHTEDSGLSYRAKSGEFLPIRSLPGLRQELRTIDNQEQVIYLAEDINPYGLKEGTLAAVFYPDVYSARNSLEEIRLVGGVAVRPAVIPFLVETMGGRSNDLFPIPIDPLSAKEDKKLIIQTVETPSKYLYIYAPPGSKFVYPFEGKGLGEENILKLGQSFILLLSDDNEILK